MKEVFRITGGEALEGRVEVRGAKNAVLPMLAASLLTEEPVTVCDCPDITDVADMVEVLRALGAEVVCERGNITVKGVPRLTEIPPHLACAMRSSVFMLGALTAQCGEVRLFTPGGCRIGARPLDIHLDGLERMGAKTEYDANGVHCFADKLHGADIIMRASARRKTW